MTGQTKSDVVKAVADHLRYLKTMGITHVPCTRKMSSVVSRQPSAKAVTDDRRPTTEDAVTALQSIRAEIGDCTRCKLCGGRTNIVFGVGNPHAALMFVGEGPGADEDAKGEPFVGRAGQLLNKIIEAMGYQRADVYIGNIVKCRPPQNRAPDPEETTTCIPFLHQQIAAIQPQVIVCLGSIATQALLHTEAKISKLRGTFHPLSTLDFTIQVMPTFHPAYLLRNPEQKRAVWEDMKKVATFLKSCR